MGLSCEDAISEYDNLWEEWQNLKSENDCCPTLYVKTEYSLDMVGYSGNCGLDTLIR